LAAELTSAHIGRWCGLRLDAQPAKRRGKGFRAPLTHGRDVDHLAAQGMIGPYLSTAVAMGEDWHRKNPLLSRYASQRVMKPASFACPSNCNTREGLPAASSTNDLM